MLQQWLMYLLQVWLTQLVLEVSLVVAAVASMYVTNMVSAGMVEQHAPAFPGNAEAVVLSAGKVDDLDHDGRNKGLDETSAANAVDLAWHNAIQTGAMGHDAYMTCQEDCAIARLAAHTLSPVCCQVAGAGVLGMAAHALSSSCQDPFHPYCASCKQHLAAEPQKPFVFY